MSGQFGGGVGGADLFAKAAGGSNNAPPGLGGGGGASVGQPGSGSSTFSAPLGLFSGHQKGPDRDEFGSAPAVPPEAYGMAGLLSVLKAGDRDIPALALGTDLSAPGVNISAPAASSHPLHALFGSPWAKDATPLEPYWTLPNSYRLPQPALKTGHLAKFDVTTLLYIFYAMPRDILQAYAAQELYSREWRYHRDLKLWFKAEGGGKGGGGGGKAATPGQPLTWSYFDITSWERKTYPSPAGTLSSGFLSEDECRVRQSSQQQQAPPQGSAALGVAGLAPGGMPQ